MRVMICSREFLVPSFRVQIAYSCVSDLQMPCGNGFTCIRSQHSRLAIVRMILSPELMTLALFRVILDKTIKTSSESALRGLRAAHNSRKVGLAPLCSGRNRPKRPHNSNIRPTSKTHHNLKHHGSLSSSHWRRPLVLDIRPHWQHKCHPHRRFNLPPVENWHRRCPWISHVPSLAKFPCPFLPRWKGAVWEYCHRSKGGL